MTQQYSKLTMRADTLQRRNRHQVNVLTAGPAVMATPSVTNEQRSAVQQGFIWELLGAGSAYILDIVGQLRIIN